MRRPANTQAHLRDDIPNPGVGLFVDGRAKASAENAYRCAASSTSERSLTKKDYAWLRKSLLEAARHYWADFDYDSRTSAVELKAEIAPLRRALAKIVQVTDKLSADARALLRAETRSAIHGIADNPVKPSPRGTADDPVEQMLQQISKVQAVCEPIMSAQGRKGPRAQDRVARCCERLWIIREYLTGRSFSKSLEKEHDDRGFETGRFARSDAEFVLAVMQAIDAKVTFSKVDDGLRSHPPSAARGK